MAEELPSLLHLPSLTPASRALPDVSGVGLGKLSFPGQAAGLSQAQVTFTPS